MGNTWITIVVCAACGVDGGDRTIVASNALGVTQLAVERYDEGVDVSHDQGFEHTFDLRGFDADGVEIAHLHRHIGYLDQLAAPAYATYDAHRGTELAVDVFDDRVSFFTRDTALEDLTELRDGGRVEQFVELPEVRQILQREAGLIDTPSGSQELAYTNDATSCPTRYMKDTPIAEDCCTSWLPDRPYRDTYHVNPLHQHRYYHRSAGPAACRTNSGSSNCSGTDCQIGPCGFRAPVVHNTPTYNYYALIRIDSSNKCDVTWTATNQQSVFPDVTGTCTYNWCLNGVPAEVSGSGGTPSDPWGYPDT